MTIRSWSRRFAATTSAADRRRVWPPPRRGSSSCYRCTIRFDSSTPRARSINSPRAASRSRSAATSSQSSAIGSAGPGGSPETDSPTGSGSSSARSAPARSPASTAAASTLRRCRLRRSLRRSGSRSGIPAAQSPRDVTCGPEKSPRRALSSTSRHGMARRMTHSASMVQIAAREVMRTHPRGSCRGPALARLSGNIE